jgi:hypothetical protein
LLTQFLAKFAVFFSSNISIHRQTIINSALIILIQMDFQQFSSITSQDALNYANFVRHLADKFSLTASDIEVLNHPSYHRVYAERDAMILQWLKDGRESWILPLYHILITPNNVMTALDFQDMCDIFTNLTAPTNVDDLSALFGGMKL